jgi:hypothetical protein
MDSNGRLFKEGEPSPKSRLYEEFERLAADGYRDLGSVTPDDLEWIQRIHDKHLDFYKEERRMHFGAFALVGLALMIILPSVLRIEDLVYGWPVLGVFVLLVVLLAPYTYVYYKYEEGVRRMMRESVILENARRLAKERARVD